jgi:hypothetical protein
MNKYNIKTLDMLERVIFLRHMELHEKEEKIKKNFDDLRQHFFHSAMEELLERIFSKRK